MAKLFLLILYLSFVIPSVAFCSDERFSVEIKVDVTDKNASIAREKAITNASRAAITAVAGRISTSDGAAKIGEMTDAQLINFVKETSVINEKNSDVRYIADLRIVINEDLLKQYMMERDIPLNQNTTGNSILIIPLFREFATDAPMLWETTNPWKQAWSTIRSTSGIKFVPISSSAGFINAINAEQASASDSQSLEKVALMSGTNDVYVLDATYNGVEGLKIIATSLSGEHFTIDVAGAKSSGAELFNQAVIESCNQISTRTLESKNTLAAIENELTILHPFSSLKQWIRTEQLIKSLNVVNKIEVQAMAQGKAQFKIFYTGTISNLKHLLSSQGYLLEDSGNYMTLTTMGDLSDVQN